MGYVFTNKNMHNFNHFYSITMSKYQILVKFGFENDPQDPPRVPQHPCKRMRLAKRVPKMESEDALQPKR